MKKYIIAAVADNGAIGKRNALLWHIPGDMKYFRQTTTGSPVIMGRKTFGSIGIPLPKRRNIVVSRSSGPVEGVEIARSLDEAFRLARTGTGQCPEKCFVIGGGEIYRQAMKDADRLYITEVHCTVNDADTFFPEISPDEWKEESRSGLMADAESGLSYEFVVYGRI